MSEHVAHISYQCALTSPQQRRKGREQQCFRIHKGDTVLFYGVSDVFFM